MEAENDVKEHKIVIDKPREMGITWIIAAYFYWRWMFTPNWSGFILSRSEAEVDDGSILPDASIFGKIRWLISMTPQALLPQGYTPKGKKGTSTDMNLKLINPVLGSSIVGSTTNTSAGRSRRFSVTWIDECFFVQHFNQVEQSLNTVSRVQIYVSSSKVGSIFDRFVKEQDEKGDHIGLTWHDHPWKDQEWADGKLKEGERNPEALRELEVSYALSDASRYYPQIKDAKMIPIEYDSGRPLYISMDIGRGDLTVIIWWQYNGRNFKIIECYSNNNKEIEWYAPFMNPDLSFNESQYQTEVQKKLLDKVRHWKKPTAWFGELDHFKKSMASNLSCAQVLQKHHINLRYNSYAITHEPRRIATAAILPMTIFNSESPFVMELYDALANSRYANSVISADSAKKPVHDGDGVADNRAAFENGAVSIARMLRNQRDEKRTEDVRSLTNSLVKYLRI